MIDFLKAISKDKKLRGHAYFTDGDVVTGRILGLDEQVVIFEASDEDVTVVPWATMKYLALEEMKP